MKFIILSDLYIDYYSCPCLIASSFEIASMEAADISRHPRIP